MILPVTIARKLLQLQAGEKLPASSLKHIAVTEMIHDGILQKQILGRSKSYLFCSSKTDLTAYINNRFGISDLEAYIKLIDEENTTRSEAVFISSNSKIKQVRSFKGFMVATLQPLEVNINERSFTLLPEPGIFYYVADFKTFSIPANVVIVGVENAENFNHLHQQSYLFKAIYPLFVCRYPYSSDLIKWLQNIPNPYLHYGDFDFAGISIYLNEYYKYLHSKASFFIPSNISDLLHKFGNRALYNNQLPVVLPEHHGAYEQLDPLIQLLHTYKKGLEQEVLIQPGNEK